jgi:hypothetical protein
VSTQLSTPTEHPETATEDKPPNRWQARALAVVPWVIAVLAVAVAVAATVQWRALEREQQTRDAVERTAGRVVLALTNWDASGDGMSETRAQLRALGTERFAADVDPLFGTPAAMARLAELQASSRGEIERIYLETIRDGSADVVAVVTQRIATGVNGSTDATLRFARLRMVLDAGVWLVDEVNLVVTEPGAIPMLSDDAAVGSETEEED